MPAGRYLLRRIWEDLADFKITLLRCKHNQECIAPQSRALHNELIHKAGVDRGYSLPSPPPISPISHLIASIFSYGFNLSKLLLFHLPPLHLPLPLHNKEGITQAEYLGYRPSWYRWTLKMNEITRFFISGTFL